MFKHHIIPKHAGGTDDPSNIKVVGSFAEHAEEHRLLWEQYGRPEDKLAWQALSAQIGKEEIAIETAKLGGSKGKQNPKKMGANNSFYGMCHTAETKSLIGKQSSERNKGQAAWNRGVQGELHHTKETKELLSKKKKDYWAENECIPWNKGKKGLQVPWNKGKKGL